jgi:transcriptional regulator with XRE-family HTH domain
MTPSFWRLSSAMKIKIKEVAQDKKGWSLYRLAKELGLPQQTVYSWASGRTQPSYDNMDRLCDILDCAVGELFESDPVQQKLF